MQDATPFSRADLLYECGRPCDALSCLSFTALWLQQSQSILMQEVQQINGVDLTCYKTLPTKSVTGLQVGPMSSDGRWLHLQNLTNPAFHLPVKIPTTNIRKTLFQLAHIYVGGDALQPPQIERGGCQGRDHIVNVRSGCRNLVVVNVHFEPELTLRSLRERLCLITRIGLNVLTPSAYSWVTSIFASQRKVQCLESDLHRR